MKNPNSFFVSLFVMVLCTATFANAGEVQESEKAPVVSFWHAVSTKYIGSDAVVYSPTAVTQHEVTVALPKGFSFDIFYSRSLKKKMKTETWTEEIEGEDGEILTETSTATTNLADGGNEIDFKVGYALPHGFELSVSYWDFYPLFKGRSGNVIASKLGWSRDFEASKSTTFSVNSAFEWYKPTSRSEFTGGCRGTLGFECSVALSDAWSIGLKLPVVLDDGSFDTDSALVASPSLELSYSYKSVSLGAKVTRYQPFKTSDIRRNQVVGEFSVSWGF